MMVTDCIYPTKIECVNNNNNYYYNYNYNYNNNNYYYYYIVEMRNTCYSSLLRLQLKHTGKVVTKLLKRFNVSREAIEIRDRRPSINNSRGWTLE